MSQATQEQIESCRAAKQLVARLHDAGWTYRVTHALVGNETGQIESIGIKGYDMANLKRRVWGVWEREVIDGEPGKWKRTPGYIWGPINSTAGWKLHIYKQAVKQAEMNAWITDPQEWWQTFLPARPAGSWGIFR